MRVGKGSYKFTAALAVSRNYHSAVLIWFGLNCQAATEICAQGFASAGCFSISQEEAFSARGHEQADGLSARRMAPEVGFGGAFSYICLGVNSLRLSNQA